MSRANITNTEKIGPNRIHVTFKTSHGEMTYEYRGNSAKALERGTDPSQLAGRLIEHKKEKK